MKAIVVREFGAPEVMKLEDVPEPHLPGPGPHSRARRRRESRSTPTSAPARTRASRICPTHQAPTSAARSRPSAPACHGSRPAIASTHMPSTAAAPQLAVCDEWQVNPLPAHDLVSAGRRAGRAVRHRVARAVHSRRRPRRRNGARPRRQRRRRHRRRADRARARHARDRHGRHRRGSRARFASRARTTCSTTASRTICSA